MRKKNEFIRLIQDHAGLHFKIVKVYARTREDEQDLYQDIVYQLYKSLATFRHEAKLSTWMYRIALNTAIAHLNTEKKKRRTIPD